MSRSLIPSLILGVAFFCLFYLIVPEYDTIKLLGQEIERRQIILDERAGAIQKVTSLGKEINSRDKDIKRLSTLIPPITQTDQVISGIDQMANQSGVRITQITTSALNADASNYQILSIGMQFFGEYNSFINFLTLLEQSLRIYDMIDITVSPSQGSASLLNFNVRVNAYFLNVTDNN